MEFKKILLDHRNGNELLSESDDIYFVYDCEKGELENWFIKRASRDKIKSYQEDEVIRDVAVWRPVDRERYPVCEKLTTDLRTLSAAMRFYLG